MSEGSVQRTAERKRINLPKRIEDLGDAGGTPSSLHLKDRPFSLYLTILIADAGVVEVDGVYPFAYAVLEAILDQLHHRFLSRNAVLTGNFKDEF